MTETTTYDHALYGVAAKWRGLIAILILVVSMLVLSLLFGAIALTIEVVNGTMDLNDPGSLLAITPGVLLATNLALAALIPISILLQRWLYGVRMGSIFSVAGGIRWRWLARLALVFAPIWIVYIGVSFLLEPTAEPRLDGTAIGLIVVAVLTTPLQAAGEEVGFRGLVQRATGAWFRNPRVAFAVSTLVSGLIFGAAHFATDWWLIAYYVLFGVAASIAARLTGGLEAFIVIHAVNNLVTFVFAAIFGSLAQGIDRSEGAGGPFMLIPIAVVLGAAVLAGWLARLSGITTRAPRPLTVRQERAAQVEGIPRGV
jgi:membrane protease YdiL (CAAX protease family)